MALDALGIFGDGDSPWPIKRILQSRRRGVAVAAAVGVHRHRVAGRMAANTEGGVQDVSKAGR